MASGDTADLLSRIRVRCALPSSGSLFSDAQILRIVDDQLLGFVAPLLKSQQQSFFQARDTQALTAGTAAYRIPVRAMGGTVHQILLVDSSGAEQELTELPPERVDDWRSNPTDQGRPRFYYFEGATVSLVPVPDSSSYSLKFVHERRPNRLIATTSATTITNISGVTVTIAGTAGFGTSAAYYDVISANSPHDSLAIDQSATRSSTTLTFTTALPSTVAVGDYVALAQESPFPQVPDDYVPLLIDRCVAVLLPLLGDTDLGADADRRAGQSAQVATSLASPRTAGAAKKIPGGAQIANRRTRYPR